MRSFGRISIVVFLASNLLTGFANAQDDKAAEEKEAPKPPATVNAVDLGKTIVVRGPLGVAVGEVIDIVASYDDEQTESVSQLAVKSVNGKPLLEPVSIAYEWSRAGDEMDLTKTEKIQLRGYQSGKFVGAPETDPLAVTAVPRLEFQATFVIARRLDTATPADKERIASLVDQLELEDDDTFLDRNRRFVKRESSGRIEKATAEITELGRAAWPVLATHFKDRRPSVVVQPTSGGHTVGVVCMEMVRRQIVNVPKGYPAGKTRQGKDGKPHSSPRLTWGFHPSLKEWLEAHKEKTLNQIHVAVLEQLIKEEDKIGYPNPEAKEAIRAKLIGHLNELKGTSPITLKN